MEKIQAQIIIEILGKPADHIKEGLQNLVTKMASEKPIIIINKNYHDPSPVKDSDLFTAFCEITLEVDSITDIFQIVFNYFPSHIEIVKPDKITFNNYDINEIVNTLAQKIHNYDAVAKRIIFERDILANKLEEVSPGSLEALKKEANQPITKSKEENPKSF